MTQPHTEVDPQELVQTVSLPDSDWDEYFSRIYVEDEIKRKLVNYGLLLDQFDRVGFDQMTLSYHGAVLLYGPPGTGKTTLAKGVANEVAKRLDSQVVFRQVDVEQLFSGRLGDTPKAVSGVFELLIESAAAGTNQIVLLDEVESLISDRGDLVGETDPMDVARAVNVALEHLDELSEYSNVYLLSTSNLPSAVDSAFFDRADVHFEVGNPNAENREAILDDVFTDLNDTFGTDLPTSGDELQTLVAATEGFSGRRIRKVVLESLADDEDTIQDPSSLDYQQIRETVTSTRERLLTQRADEAEATDLLELDETDTAERETGQGTEADAGNDSNDERPSRPADPPSETTDEVRTSSASDGVERTGDGSTTDSDDEIRDEPGDSGTDDEIRDESEENATSEGQADSASDELFGRRTVVDNLESQPVDRMLERVGDLFATTFEKAGRDDGDRIRKLLTSDNVYESAMPLCSQEALRAVELAVGERTVHVDVDYALGDAEPISEPFDDVTSAVPTDGGFTLTFVVDESVVGREYRMQSLSVTSDDITLETRSAN